MVYWIPLAILLVFAPFSTHIDISLAHYFYDTQSPFTPIYRFIFNYLAYFTWMVLTVVGICLLISFTSEKYRKWQKPALYLVTTFVIGAGLIVHLVFKDHWGRPRPKQTVEFGGVAEYRPFYQPDFSDKGRTYKSFPCGHCSVGFYFFAFMVLGRRFRKPWLYHSGLWMAILTGMAFGIARMGEGGHFFSDVLACAAIMWWTAWAFDHLFFEYVRKDEGADKKTIGSS